MGFDIGYFICVLCVFLSWRIFQTSLTHESISEYLCLFSALPILRSVGFCVRASADLPGCLADVTRCLQLAAAAAAGGPSAQTESAGGIKGPSPKKATGVGLRLVCSFRCLVTSDVCETLYSHEACCWESLSFLAHRRPPAFLQHSIFIVFRCGVLVDIQIVKLSSFK